MMDEKLLLSALRRDIDNSTGESFDQLNYARAKALKYYLGEPLGNEMKGRSQVVTSEVADTIESMLPQVLEPFIASDRVVFFDPVGQEDIPAAKQETEYVNHVVNKDNEGFDILYTWCKDGLLSKNGIVKYYWEEKKEVTTESYTGLDVNELMGLIADDEVEVVEQTEEIAVVVDPQSGMEMEQASYDVKIKRTRIDGQVKIVNIPPEEFLIDATWNSISLKDCQFCGHETYMTLSDLKAMGYDVEEIKQSAGQSEDDWSDVEKDERFRDISESQFDSDDESPVDEASRKVKVTECYKRIDYDEDGFAELRRIILVGEHYILENEEFDYIPFECFSPIPMTHRFFGRSAADQTMDIQLQKTMLTRNILDNLYQQNNVRMGVLDGEANVSDVLDNTPGGIVRMSRPDALFPIPVQPFSGHAFGMLEYLDTIKENRTGDSRYNQGMDADSLNKTAHGIERIMNASAKRLQMISRIFGQSVKRLMLGIHRLLIQNQDKEKIVKIRGQYIPINPSEWRERTNMSVMVGLGTENRDKTLQHLMMILQIQKEAMMGGTQLASPQNLYNTAIRIVENAGEKEPELFFTDPTTVEPMPPQPSAEEKMVEMQGMIAQQDHQIKQMKQSQDFEIEKAKLALDRDKIQLEARKVAILEARMQIDAAKAGNEAMNDAFDRNYEAAKAEVEGMVS